MSIPLIVPRYWYPREREFDLSPLGFLMDPEGKYGDLFAAGAVPFSSLREKPFLVLVGEPGTGKSTEFERNVQPADGRDVCFINLRAYGSEESLRAAFREHRQIERWKGEGGTLELYLDSYDESPIRNLAYVLQSAIAALVPRARGRQEPGREVRFAENPERTDEVTSPPAAAPTHALMVRVACRMGAYDTVIGETIREGLGTVVEAPYEYKLAPLREADVRELIEGQGHDADRFLEEVQRLSIGFLAAKPITLDLLLRAYGNDQKLGESALEIYEKGVRSLCEEPSRYRKATSNVRPDIGRRLQTARQAAALSILCGRPELWLDNDSDCTSKDLLTVGEIALGEVGERDVFDLGDTALLAPMSTRRFGWAHKTIAEFLAGRHLVESRLSAGQITNLLVDPESEKVFPQFRETAAWVAASHDEFRRWMIGNEPETVLASDVALFAASDKEEIVDRLLGALDHEELFTIDSDASGKYGRLSYPGLGSQLRPWIVAREKTIFVRREAIDIAAACRLKELEPELVGIALDVEEDRNARISAAHAIVEFGSAGSKYRLRPLADEPTERDPDAELRGYGLRACWPDCIALTDALRAIGRPRKGRLIGAFWGFKKRDFARGFRREFLREALVWLLRSDAPRRGRRSEGVAGVLFAEAWTALPDTDVCDLLGRIWARRAKRFEETFEFEDEDSLSREDLASDPAKRRALVESVVRHSKGNDHVFLSLVDGQRGLLTGEDADWVWEHVFVGTARERARWAALAYWLPPERERVLQAAETEPAVRRAFAAWLRPPEPESSWARSSRERAERLAAREDERRARAEQADIPGRVNRLLDDALVNPAKFWTVHRDLVFKADATGSELDWVQPDVTRLPGWEFITEDRKESWSGLCEAYLRLQSAVPEGWKARTIQHPDVAGYRSLRWLLEHRASSLVAQGNDLFRRWASAVVFMTDHLWDQESEYDRAVLRLFYASVPFEVRRCLAVLLRREARSNTDSMVFGHFDAIWDEELGDLYLSFVRGRAKRASYRYALLKKLVARGFAPAVAYAKARIRDERGGVEERRVRRVAMAKALLEASDASWPFLLPILRNDLELAREALGEFVHGTRDENMGQILASVGHTGLGELYELLLEIYPADDGRFEGGFVDERQSIIWFRDAIPRFLSGLGTPEALLELLRLRAAHPSLLALKMYVMSARKQLRRAKWRPSKPSEVVSLCESSAGRLVENGDQLLEVIVEALGAIGRKMVDRGEYESYWHEPRGKGDPESLRPKDENMLSGFVAARLEDHLVNQGIVVNREVEVRRGNKTDIYVTAISRRKGAYEPITVVVETKGCWHDELASAMETQLLGDYLAVPGRNHGVYLVGWYDCEAWTGRDGRRAACRKAARTMPPEFFQAQARGLASGGKLIRYVGLDCRYYGRSPKGSNALLE